MSTNPERPRFSPLEENILAAVLFDGGLAPRDIAERVGVLCSRFFLEVLESMADRHLLQVEGAGYAAATGASPGGKRGCPAGLNNEAGGPSRPDEGA